MKALAVAKKKCRITITETIQYEYEVPLEIEDIVAIECGDLGVWESPVVENRKFEDSILIDSESRLEVSHQNGWLSDTQYVTSTDEGVAAVRKYLNFGDQECEQT